MFSRLKNSLLFRLEQTMVRGPAARLAFILTLVVLVAIVGGLLARALAPGFDRVRRGCHLVGLPAPHRPRLSG